MSTTRSLISRVRTRWALAGAIEDLEVGAVWGAGAAAVTLATTRFLVDGVSPWWSAGVGVATALSVPLVHLALHRRDERTVAAAADERLGLAERVSTAMWVERNAGAAADFGPLVVADAEAIAARVRPEAIAKAFRPRVLRRPLIGAAALAAVCAGILLIGGTADAVVESKSQRDSRLRDAERLAEVARKVQEAAKRVEENAAQRKETDLAKVAGEIQRRTDPLTRAPSPPREEALKQLNALADLAREQARRAAGMREAADPQEAERGDKALEELLAGMSKAGLESLKKDLSELEKRLKNGEKGEKGPSAEDVRKIANRLDALRKAMEQAAGDADSAKLLQKLRSVGNEAMLAKIAERMRQIAARMDRGEDYSDLQQASDGEETDLSEMSEEELQQLLDDLDELAGMKDLEEMMRQAGSEMRGGRKLRLGGSGGT
jgi:hypothetical protein